MVIRSQAGLTQALQEFNRLELAEPGTPEARRRDELDGAIQRFSAGQDPDLRKGRPASIGQKRRRGPNRAAEET